MPGVGFDTFFRKTANTVFVVKNITAGKYRKTVRIFNYPIYPGATRDLLAIPEVSEADIRHSLLKGDLKVKLDAEEIKVVNSNIDLIQFDDTQRTFLANAGITIGLDPTTGLTATQHELLRQLIHMADGDGPYEGFDGAYREILPPAAAFPTQVIWYTSSAKTAKIMEKDVTFDGNYNPIVVAWTMYDTDGVTVLAVVTDNITYSSSFELTRTRTVVT